MSLLLDVGGARLSHSGGDPCTTRAGRSLRRGVTTAGHGLRRRVAMGRRTTGAGRRGGAAHVTCPTAASNTPTPPATSPRTIHAADVRASSARSDSDAVVRLRVAPFHRDRHGARSSSREDRTAVGLRRRYSHGAGRRDRRRARTGERSSSLRLPWRRRRPQPSTTAARAEAGGDGTSPIPGADGEAARQLTNGPQRQQL